MPFTGLPRALPSFLADLAAHNDRDWFAAHQAAYQSLWLGPGLDLAAALSAPCAALTPPLLAVPKLNASLRRIHRDTRFGADKRPYHAQLHLILSSGPDFNKVPGVHLVIDAQGLGFGAGQYQFAPPALERYRHWVVSAQGRAQMQQDLDRAAAIGCLLDPPHLARVPKGFAADPAWDGLIRRKGVIVRCPAPQPLPDWLFTDQAVEGLMALVRALNPLVGTLARLA